MKVIDKTKVVKVHQVFLIDASGSMGFRKDEVIEGFNNSLAELKTLELPPTITLAFFNDDLAIHNMQDDLVNAKPLTKEDYIPNGNTALWDSIGTLASRLKVAKSDKVVFNIFTDGMNNASREFNNTIIDTLRSNQGWIVNSFGMNEMAVEGVATSNVRKNNNASELFTTATRSAVAYSLNIGKGLETSSDSYITD